MIRKAAAALTGLGLIGGTATVIHNKNGDETVRIKNDKTGQVQSVRISGSNGQSFSCPSGEHNKLDPYVVRAARIKLTIRQVRGVENGLLKEYPNGAPHRVVVRFKALNHRDDRLVNAFNAQVDAHNAILERDCSRAG